MSKSFKFEATSIPSQYSINLKDVGGVWVDSRTADIYRIIFSAISDTLKINQSKDAKRIGMLIKDDKGEFKFGAILNYRKPEEGSEEDSGNWYLEFTFDQEDMKDLDIELDNLSDVFVQCMAQEANAICYGRFRSVALMQSMLMIAIKTLKDFLDVNADENEEVEVELTGIFKASVAVEDGKKYMSIVPGEYIKQLIKNDSAL